MAGAHILLVEDTMTQALMMQHLLESEGYKISVAKDAEKALEFLASERPDAILSDVSMPGMDGYELCRKVKANPSTENIPFVLLSSFREASDIIDIINSGADNFLLKRFEQEYIVAGLKDVLLSGGKRAAAIDSKPTEQITVTFLEDKQIVSTDAVKLTNMLASAFRTVVHVIPLISED
jgi:two-component system cell cycle response regulator